MGKRVRVRHREFTNSIIQRRAQSGKARGTFPREAAGLCHIEARGLARAETTFLPADKLKESSVPAHPRFPETFTDVRHNAREWFDAIRERWPKAEWHSEPLYPDEGLTFDWIEARRASATQALVLTAGLHGVEGYAGAAMLELFVSEFLPRVNLETTGLYLVPVINPWGMVHYRRVNPQNVDLNRNFLNEEDYHRDLNPDYATLAPILHPERPVAWRDRFLFYPRILGHIQRHGVTGLRNIFPQGQSIFPKGMHYTGRERQPEANALLAMLNHVLALHERVVIMDMHTGYGPKGLLTLVFPGKEPRTVEVLRQQIGYAQVTKVAGSDFYPIHGDLSSYLHELARETPVRELYTFALEVGTLGDAPLPQLRSMRALILENQLYWYGATGKRVARWVREEFLALFYPADREWRHRVVIQTRAVYTQVLTRLMEESGPAK